MTSFNSESPHKKSKLFYGWWVLIALFIVGAMGPMARYSVTAFFPALSKEFGWTRSQIGTAQSISLWAYAGLVLLTGWMIDRFGGRKTIIFGGLCCLAGWLLLSKVHSLWQLYLFYGFFMAVAVANTHLVPVQVISRKWFIKRAGLAAGVLGSAFVVGTSLFSPLLTYMAGIWSWHTVAIIAGFTFSIPILLLGYFVIRDTPESIALLPDGVGSPAEVPKQQMAADRSWTFKDAIKTPQLWLLFVAYGLSGMVFNAIASQIVIWGVDLGMKSASAGFMVTLFSLPSIITRVGGGWFGDRFGKMRVMIIGTAISMAAMFVGWRVIHTPAQLLFFAPILGLSVGPATNLFAPYLGDIFGRKNVGSLFAILTLAWGSVGGFGPIIWGTLRDRTGSYDIALLVSAGCYAVALLALFLCRPPKVKNQFGTTK
jgi:MFS family permease